jgi:hypothetical protein
MARDTNPNFNPADNVRELEVRFIRPRPSDPTGGLASLKLTTQRLRKQNQRMSLGLAIGFAKADEERSRKHAE